MSLLDKGMEVMGAAHRTFDKFGKRMWSATPKLDNSNEHKHLAKPKRMKK